MIYLALAAVFYGIVAEDWSRAMVNSEAVNRDAVSPELSEGVLLRQDFEVTSDQLNAITLQANVLPANREGRSFDCLLRAEDVILMQKTVSVDGIPLDGKIRIETGELPKGLNGKRLTMELKGNGGISFWMGNTRSAGKFSVATENLNPLTVNGEPAPGELVMQQSGVRELPYRRYYWPAALGLGAVLLAFALYAGHRRETGRSLAASKAVDLAKQYSYLLKTLVIRDFKVKYKASMLGVIWSFLNPLLMTLVYYFVFSTIFQSSIPYFPAYLMSGIVVFNFFSETTNLGMLSIVGNAGLITKVYIPKYIFPVSKVFSSAINLIISLVPLFLMMAGAGVQFHKSLFLLPVVIAYLVIFCIGISLILSASMVYFRDVQFLWGIMLTVLNFFSPIFYPESIIPARFITVYHMNPLYQFLFFMRTITIGGISPTPVTYLYCTIASFGALALGLLIFRKTQSQFVLHL